MYTTYHLESAQELNEDLIEAIKATFKSKPIQITVEEDEIRSFELTDEQKAILDERLLEDKSNYIPSYELFKSISKRYGI